MGLSAGLPQCYELVGASLGTLHGINLRVPHNSITSVHAAGPVGKTVLVHGIVHCYSRWLLEQALASDRFTQRAQPKTIAPTVDFASGVLPTISLNELFESMSRTQRVGQFLDLERLLTAAVEAIARPNCELADCSMAERSARTLVPEIISAMVGARFERAVLLIGFSVRLDSSALSECLEHFIAEGYRRFLIDGRLVRVSPDDRGSLTAALAGNEGRADGDLVVLFESLSKAEASQERLADAISQAQKIDRGVVRVYAGSAEQLRFDGSRLHPSVMRWSVFEGFSCERCGMEFSTSKPHDPSLHNSSLTLRVGDVPADSVMELSIGALRDLFIHESNRLGAHAPTVLLLLIGRLNALIDLNLINVPLARTIGELSAGERFRAVMAKLSDGAMAGGLLILDCPERMLGLQAAAVLAPWCAARLKDGDTLLIASDLFDVLALATHVWELRCEAEGGEVRLCVTEPRSVEKGTARPRVSPRYKDSTRMHTFDAEALAGLPISLPIGGLTTIFGPSGSGKSRLLQELARRADSAGFNSCRVLIAESQSGKALLTRGGRVSDILGLGEAIATLYAHSRAARSAGLAVERFDRSASGACDRCRGMGEISISLDVLGRIAQPCARCGGSGYGARVSEIVVSGKTIAETCSLSLAELLSQLPLDRSVIEKLQLLDRIGLGGLRLELQLSMLAESERTLLALAIILASKHRRGKLVLLDGIFDGLDEARVQLAEEECARFCRSGATVVLTSSSPGIAQRGNHQVRLPSS